MRRWRLLPHVQAFRAALVERGFAEGTDLTMTFLLRRWCPARHQAHRPADRAADIETIVNLKTAEALGLKVRQSLLVRADRVTG